jgi:glucose/mannose-6-phosphate isomerase
VGRAGALLRGAGPAPVDDLFRDRLDETPAVRPRLLVVGDDGSADDVLLGDRSDAQIQLDEVAARRAAKALHDLAAGLGLRSSSVDVPAGDPLARFASATAFGEFTATYLALGLGLDPGSPGPAERAH